VSVIFILALVPAVLRAILLAFVSVVAVLTDNEDRRRVALVVLRILAPSSPTSAALFTPHPPRAARKLNKTV
jgi:hypothetical protein